MTSGNQNRGWRFSHTIPRCVLATYRSTTWSALASQPSLPEVDRRERYAPGTNPQPKRDGVGGVELLFFCRDLGFELS